MAADADFNADLLVEEGLQLYGQGELDAALTKWRLVLDREPENHRAREYLRYVEDNRAALEESFRLARQQATPEPAPMQPREEPFQVLSAELASEAEKGARVAGVRSSPTARAKTGGGPRREVEITPARATMPLPGLEEASRQVLELPLLGSVRTAETLVDEDDALDVIEEPALAGSSQPPPLPGGEADPSFLELADEIAETAQRISDELPHVGGHGPLAFDPDDDYTPRLDLGELKARVAETKRRLSQELSPAGAATTGERPTAPPAPIRSSTGAPPLVNKASTIPGPPPVVESSVSSRPTPSGGLSAASTGSGRDRRSTPLSLIEGGSGGPGSVGQDFEPFEATPVAQKIPRPARLVPSPEPRDAPASLVERLPGPAEKSLGELNCDTATPAKLSRTPPKSAQGSAELKAATSIGLGPELAGDKKPSTTPARQSAEKLESLLESARQLHEQGTFEGSLWLCERVLTMDVGCAEAHDLLHNNQQILLRQYRQQLGDATAIPVVQIPQHEIMWHKLDHRAGFLLSRIDGQLSFDDLLDVSGMTEFEACRILSQLLSQGVIGPRR